MRALVVGVALLASCDRVFGLQRDDDERTCFGLSGPNRMGLLEVCLTEPVPEQLIVPPDIDTDDAPPPPCTQMITLEDADATELCVIAARTIEISNGSLLHGKRPVVFVAIDSITVEGDLDASSKHAGMKGPGLSGSDCQLVQATGRPSDSGGGGGAGGGFGSKGGHGGQSIGAGGMEISQLPISHIRAGCAAGRGGKGGGTGIAGEGGEGGGAVYLIAGGTITVNGRINASGAGGGGGIKYSTGGGGGGGGGGAGGLIGLDAPIVRLGSAARLVANGGGGGAGGGSVVNGGPGADPNVIGGDPPFGALGGTAGVGIGSAGGSGGADGSLAGGNGGNASSGGGGGGGGGVGYVRIYTMKLVDLGAAISPPAGP